MSVERPSTSGFVDGRFFQQTDSVAMGSPLGATLSNNFLAHNECNLLSNCPDSLKDHVLSAIC